MIRTDDSGKAKRFQQVMRSIGDQLHAAVEEYTTGGTVADKWDAAFSTVGFVYRLMGLNPDSVKHWLGCQLAAAEGEKLDPKGK